MNREEHVKWHYEDESSYVKKKKKKNLQEKWQSIFAWAPTRSGYWDKMIRYKQFIWKKR